MGTHIFGHLTDFLKYYFSCGKDIENDLKIVVIFLSMLNCFDRAFIYNKAHIPPFQT